ncbi:MAG: hypothetical protein AAGD38_16660 [Acidobacteriota bacterium]
MVYRCRVVLFTFLLLVAPALYAGGGSPDGDSYSFEHLIGALIDGSIECSDMHQSGMDDNTVLFDGLSELLDPYINGTQPLVFEFESTSSGGDPTVNLNSFSDSGGDLFPEGFTDPDTGTPLDSACIEIGMDDPLDFDSPTKVENAMLEFSNSSGPFGSPMDITEFFEDPWDGRLTIGLEGFAGQDIDDVSLVLELGPSDSIFSDGFESGDTSSWSSTVP